MKNIFGWGVALITLLTACSSAAPLPQRSPTATITPSLTPTATETALPPYVATRMAGATAHALTQIVREDNALTDCNGYPSRTRPPDRYYSSTANWYSAYCEYPDTHFQYTAIIKAGSPTIWKIPFYETWGSHQISDTRPQGITNGEMTLSAWSPDDKYVFLKPYFCCLDGPGMIFVAGHGLFQFDLATGEIMQIDGGSSAFALSPDTTKLARYDYDTRQVVIQNLEAKNRITFEVSQKFENIGIFRWSPDGSKVVFSAADENWFDAASGFAIYLIDLNQNSMRQLLYDPPNLFNAVEWLTDEEIVIAQGNYPPQYRFNITTNQLSLLDLETITPSPSP